MANSAAIIGLRDCDLDLVRPGIMLYGLYPSGTVSHEAVRLQEVMTLRAKVALVKEVPPGTGIGYGRTYVTRQAEDHRHPADRLRGRLLPPALGAGPASRCRAGGVPVVGRICMDQCMINITGLDVRPGDVVTLFGGEGPGKVFIDDVADWLGTNAHEVIGRIDKRVPRVYLRGGRVVQVRDYLQELQEPAPDRPMPVAI